MAAAAAAGFLAAAGTGATFPFGGCRRRKGRGNEGETARQTHGCQARRNANPSRKSSRSAGDASRAHEGVHRAITLSLFARWRGNVAHCWHSRHASPSICDAPWPRRVWNTSSGERRSTNWTSTSTLALPTGAPSPAARKGCPSRAAPRERCGCRLRAAQGYASGRVSLLLLPAPLARRCVKCGSAPARTWTAREVVALRCGREQPSPASQAGCTSARPWLEADQGLFVARVWLMLHSPPRAAPRWRAAHHLPRK